VRWRTLIKKYLFGTLVIEFSIIDDSTASFGTGSGNKKLGRHSRESGNPVGLTQIVH
jgi:hypothetical protein